ncbi:MAG: LPP20 family lipoprotein [Candidatus Aureabacteria bacterium]|nr:LPP20 family lipoprotein [Candidatus Auribacterota bacterium]
MKKTAFITIFIILCMPAYAGINVTNVTGTVKSHPASSESWGPLRTGNDISKGSIIKTESLSFADLLFDQDNRFRIMENTEVEVSSISDPQTLESGKTVKLLSLHLYNGTIGAKLDKLPEGTRVNIETPSAVAGALGTGFTVKTTGRTSITTVSVIENRVLISSGDSPDKTVTADAFKQVNVSPWKHTNLSATGTGILSEAILGKQKVENMKSPIVIKSSGTGVDETEAKSMALLALCEKIYSIKLSGEETISDIVYHDRNTACRLLEAVSNAEIKGSASDSKNSFTVFAELKLGIIENIIGRKILSVQMPVYKITLKEYGDKFGALARVTTRRAALVDGYRRLAEKIYGTVIDSKTTLNDYAISNDSIKQRVEGVVKGAAVNEESYFSDGSVTVACSITGLKIVSEVNSVSPDLDFGENYVSSPENISYEAFSVIYNY